MGLVSSSSLNSLSNCLLLLLFFSSHNREVNALNVIDPFMTEDEGLMMEDAERFAFGGDRGRFLHPYLSEMRTVREEDSEDIIGYVLLSLVTF